MNNSASVRRETRIGNPAINTRDTQSSCIAWLSAAQWVENSGFEYNPAVNNVTYYATMCFLIAVLIKYFFCHWMSVVAYCREFYSAGVSKQVEYREQG